MTTPVGQNGAVLYNGPSKLNGEEIVAIVCFHSQNPKTGDMAQVFILDANVSPLAAAETGADASVCGDCKHRQAEIGSCYVNVAYSPQQVWRAWKRGAYKNLRWGALTGRDVRFGAYGDPAAVPNHIWERVLAECGRHTSYTHAWKTASELRSHSMASVDTPEERLRAKRRGWRTFRVRLDTEPVEEGEIICPASDEGGNKTTCQKCGLCNGAMPVDGRKDIVIIGHGKKAGRLKVLQT